MVLSDKEKYVAEIIKNEFSKNHSNVFYTEGKDPPDIYLKYDSKIVAIELTELSSNLDKNRISVDKGYEGFIKNISITIPDYTHWLIVFHHANIRLNKKRKKDIQEFLENPCAEMEKCINGILVKIEPMQSENETGTISHKESLDTNSCSSDMNTVLESLRDSNTKHIFQSIVNKAIETKKRKCRNVNKPIWLAMHDSYFSYAFNQSKEESIEI